MKSVSETSGFNVRLITFMSSDLENELNIKIFPSIGSNKLFVEGNFSEKPHFLIYDENCNKILNYESYYLNKSKFSINTSRLEDGLYIIFFNNFGILNPKRKKFVIINR